MPTVTLDYEPSIDREPYDPVPAGGGVDLLRLYVDEARATVPVVEVGPAVRVTPEGDPRPRFRFSFPQPPDGTYYASILWRDVAGATPYLDADEIVAFPLPTDEEPPLEGLAVSVTEVARRAGFPQPISPAVRQAIEDAIGDAQGDVEAHLGRPVVPIEATESNLYAHPDGWQLKERPVIRILSVVADTTPEGALTGNFTVTYLYGLDAANAPLLRPIRNYIARHAAALVRQSPAATTAKIARGIRSVNVEGQGITYSDTVGAARETGGGSGEIGALPTLASLDRWRLAGRRVFQRR